MTNSQDKTILVTSGYGGNTKKPFVMVEGDEFDKPIQFSPTDARALAQNLLRAAEAAESDAVIVNFLHGELELPMGKVAEVLVMFRKFRGQS
jgi:hypothetical protein